MASTSFGRDFDSMTWVALGAVSETHRPDEWTAVMEVIFNRMRDPRYPDKARDVVLQRKQFSYFNNLPREEDVAFYMAKLEDALRPHGRIMLAGFALAVNERWGFDPLLPHDVLNFFSPRSMKNRERPYPTWALSAERAYDAKGRPLVGSVADFLRESLSPDERFIFLSGVP